MHDLSYFREHLDVFAGMAKRRNITLDLDGFRKLDKERRELITENEHRKAERNKASNEIARRKKEKQSADSILAEMKQLSERIKQADERVAEMDATQRELLLTIPNIPHSSVPAGHGAEDNKEVRRWGTAPKFDFQPRPHWEVGERAGILDLEAAARITGARFAVYKGWGARLERALANFFLDVHTREHGYGNLAPVPCKYRFTYGRGPTPEVCCGALQVTGHGFLADAYLGSGATQPLSRHYAHRGTVADSRDRLDFLLPLRSRCGG